MLRLNDSQDSKQRSRTQLHPALRVSALYCDSTVLAQTGLRPSTGYVPLDQISTLVSNSISFLINSLLLGGISLFSFGKTGSDRFSVLTIQNSVS